MMWDPKNLLLAITISRKHFSHFPFLYAPPHTFSAPRLSTR
jgi:hypothetical protein